jgi:CRP/FNR family transcriptional regulator, anaerobic regulatory protein
MSLATITPQPTAFRPWATPLASESRARKTDPFARLAAKHPLETIAHGTTFADEGEPAGDVFKIEAGAVKVFKLLMDGRRQIIGFLVPGDVFGFVSGETYTASAEAVDTVSLRRFPRRQLERMFDDEPGLERQFLELMTQSLAAAQDQMLLLGRKSAHERVASFLLALADRQGTRDGWISVPMNRTDTADYLGLTMETVSRMFTVLRGTGCIASNGLHSRDVRIIDADALRELADGVAEDDV